MKTKDITVCDICKERKSVDNCYICENDVCKDHCVLMFFLETRNDYGKLEYAFKSSSYPKKKEDEGVVLCQECKIRIGKNTSDPDLFNEDFNKRVLDLIISQTSASKL